MLDRSHPDVFNRNTQTFGHRIKSHYHLLALVGAHHILHVSWIRVKIIR